MSKPLFIVTFSNGSTDDLPSNATVWLDLDRGNAGGWQALCTAKQVVDFRAGIGGNFDGEIENVKVWDGSTFGDGACGCVSSPSPGILDISEAQGFVTMPADWVAA